MKIEDFLSDRLAEARASFGSLTQEQRLVFERMFSAQSLLIDEHKKWPVLLESRPVFETSDDNNRLVMRMTQNIEFITREEYRKRFGSETPTAPMLRAMAQVYRDHPDFDESWL